MGNAEGLVQIEVADIGPDPRRRRQAHLRVHIGPVEIDLAAAGVDQGADLLDRGFEDPVGRGVGHHQGGQLMAVLRQLGPEVLEIDVPRQVAADRDHLEAAHRGRGRVGPVRARGNQADVAPALAAGRMVGADREEAGVFALGARVGLERDGREAGDLREPILQVAEEPG